MTEINCTRRRRIIIFIAIVLLATITFFVFCHFEAKRFNQKYLNKVNDYIKSNEEKSVEKFTKVGLLSLVIHAENDLKEGDIFYYENVPEEEKKKDIEHVENIMKGENPSEESIAEEPEYEKFPQDWEKEKFDKLTEIEGNNFFSKLGLCTTLRNAEVNLFLGLHTFLSDRIQDSIPEKDLALYIAMEKNKISVLSSCSDPQRNSFTHFKSIDFELPEDKEEGTTKTISYFIFGSAT
ncbi:hypothetical protein CWI36_0543p0020 [Hamiltosporidium magnivora]|uniref:Uncharacterized protein n=1 Tax=Hamiltosporidium magnivora TaxID=148818 RepID=A0A4V2JVZ5_9MICR|nr:hypothetical protein CWI36_0543p0020 [Hamiltosporidium magnivora]